MKGHPSSWQRLRSRRPILIEALKGQKIEGGLLESEAIGLVAGILRKHSPYTWDQAFADASILVTCPPTWLPRDIYAWLNRLTGPAYHDTLITGVGPSKVTAKPTLDELDFADWFEHAWGYPHDMNDRDLAL